MLRQMSGKCKEEQMENYAIEMRHITKVFPGIIANDDISLSLREGEILALLGENGAGKSTLMSILFGLYKPSSGEIYVRGKKESISSPNDADRLGIGMVHQHFKLVDSFTVLENIVLGKESVHHGVLRMREAREKILALSKAYGFEIDLDAKVSDITVGMQQRVEILKMLYRDNNILIFDEPTAVLTPQEIDELMKVTKNLSARGKSIIFISHKLKEIKQIADRCTVLRLGKCIGTVDVASTTMEEMSEMMVGRKLNLSIDKKPAHPGDAILSVHNLVVMDPVTGTKKVNNVSFEARAGEITCIAGIDNNGQSEMVLALAGMIESKGDISLDGERITDKGIRYRNTHGVSHIPEDRHKHGLVLDFNLDENMILQTYFTPEFSSHGFLRAKAIEDYAEEMIREYDIRCANGTLTNVRSMSGGNQQKIILAREISRAHDLLIAVQPTRGLDIGAARFIHEQLVKERDSGKAVLLVSLELDEVMEVSDRILVMHSGEIVADVRPKEVSIQELGLYMAGAKRSVSV